MKVVATTVKARGVGRRKQAWGRRERREVVVT